MASSQRLHHKEREQKELCRPQCLPFPAQVLSICIVWQGAATESCKLQSTGFKAIWQTLLNCPSSETQTCPCAPRDLQLSQFLYYCHLLTSRKGDYGKCYLCAKNKRHLTSNYLLCSFLLGGKEEREPSFHCNLLPDFKLQRVGVVMEK